jgi:hypothetical protein
VVLHHGWTLAAYPLFPCQFEKLIAASARIADSVGM